MVLKLVWNRQTANKLNGTIRFIVVVEVKARV